MRSLIRLDQSVACPERKLGVGLQHFYGEVDFVSHALPGAVAGREKFEIGLPVIGFLAVDVMDSLILGEGSADHLLHDVTMVEHFDGWRARDTDSKVSMPSLVNGRLSVGVFLRVLKATVHSLALNAAKVFAPVFGRAVFANDRNIGPALTAGVGLKLPLALPAARRGAVLGVFTKIPTVPAKIGLSLAKFGSAVFALKLVRDDISVLAHKTGTFARFVASARAEYLGSFVSFCRETVAALCTRVMLHIYLPNSSVHNYAYRANFGDASTFKAGVA